MTTHDIRKKFLEFFASKAHAVLASDSLVPKDDPTVLFTTAGMQQFKKNFLGEAKDLRRAATSQKCLRTDDLAQVGVTAFHHTFFEMLGNFSFGDYFKKDAIAWAWEFLTEWMKLPKEKLWVSVYHEDSEAKSIWTDTIKIDPRRIVALGDKSNFWPSQAKANGPNGPCGPCSEIFYDYGPEVGCKRPDCDPGCDCGRFSEIWNLVFTQFNRKDGGVLEPLPSKNIDTGMGLERLAAVIQGKKTNFEIDLFEPILEAIDREAAKAKIALSAKERFVMADHIRAVVFGIADGVVPSNEGRGYVIKKLITDATDILLEKGSHSFIYKLVPSVVAAMKNPYDDLLAKESNIFAWIKKTEEAYQKVRETRIPELKKEAKAVKSSKELGDIIFKYRDTYGLTLSAIRGAIPQQIETKSWKDAICYYDNYMDQQREKSRAASKMTGDVFTSTELDLAGIAKTKFLGYDGTGSPSKILALFVDATPADTAQAPANVKVILDKTPFYAESGGQIGDSGVITTGHAVIAVSQTLKISDVFVHLGQVKSGTIKKGEAVTAQVDAPRRLDIMRNHTATHLLQAALREVLGSHVQQQGSLVTDARLRFDFTHPKALTEQELGAIEERVNAMVQKCLTVNKKEMSLAEAKAKGALAFFAEKYGAKVRVVAIGDTSTELCGGTHLDNAGAIGVFKILGEGAIAQGIRRLEAVTGPHALDLIRARELKLNQIAGILKAPQDEVLTRLQAQTQKLKELERDLSLAKLEAVKSSLDERIKNAKNIDGINYISLGFEGMDVETLRRIADLLKQKARCALIALGTTNSDGTTILVCVTDELTGRLKANEVVAKISKDTGASGGGRSQMAQAGAKERLDLNNIFQLIENLIHQS